MWRCFPFLPHHPVTPATTGSQVDDLRSTCDRLTQTDFRTSCKQGHKGFWVTLSLDSERRVVSGRSCSIKHMPDAYTLYVAFFYAVEVDLSQKWCSTNGYLGCYLVSLFLSWRQSSLPDACAPFVWTFFLNMERILESSSSVILHGCKSIWQCHFLAWTKLLMWLLWKQAQVCYWVVRRVNFRKGLNQFLNENGKRVCSKMAIKVSIWSNRVTTKLISN